MLGAAFLSTDPQPRSGVRTDARAALTADAPGGDGWSHQPVGSTERIGEVGSVNGQGPLESGQQHGGHGGGHVIGMILRCVPMVVAIVRIVLASR